MISHAHRCIFIHIPKCAGTSIESALGHFDQHVGRGGQDHRTIRMIEEPLTAKAFASYENVYEFLRRMRHRYRPVMNWRNQITLTAEQYRSYYKFTFVRNPWARVYSWYKGVMRDDVIKGHLRITGHLTLKAFLRRFAGKGMLRPQIYWLKDFSGAIAMDYIGRFENLSEDFEHVCKAMRIETPLPHRNKGKGGHYRQYYDAESIDIVSRVYNEEIEMFGYRFAEAPAEAPPPGLMPFGQQAGI